MDDAFESLICLTFRGITFMLVDYFIVSLSFEPVKRKGEKLNLEKCANLYEGVFIFTFYQKETAFTFLFYFRFNKKVRFSFRPHLKLFN